MLEEALSCNFQQLPVPGNSRYGSDRFSELMKHALNPADEIVMEEIFQTGFESGEHCGCCSVLTSFSILKEGNAHVILRS